MIHLCICRAAGQDMLVMHHIPFVPVESHNEDKEGRIMESLLVRCQKGPYGSSLVNGKDSDRKRLGVEDILVERRDVCIVR